MSGEMPINPPMAAPLYESSPSQPVESPLEKSLPRKHPRDWAAQKKTSDAILALAVAIAWHERLAADTGDVDDNGTSTYAAPIVDPVDNETQPVTEAEFDHLVKVAVVQLRSCREAAPPNKRRFVRVLQHPSALHAVIVRVVDGADAKAFLHQVKNPPDGVDANDHQAYQFSKYLLWPLMATLETDFYVASSLVYPLSYLGLLGMRGIEVKERA